MAPSKRQRTTGPAQATLSFSRSKPSSQGPASTKVSKPTTGKPTVSSEKAAKSIEESSAPSTDDIVLEQADAEPAPQADPEPDDEDATAARAITDRQLKAYWAAKERARKAPRVHQQALGLHEKILREFDMQTRFGPCIGIQRLARWRRARELGMEPPVEVLAVLLREEGGAPGKERSQTSILDELILSSRITGEVGAA